MKYKGLELTEPTLVFCDKRGTGTSTDTHPVRGLAASRPYDFPLTMKGLAPSLRVGVICPRSEAPLLRGYLQNVNQGHRPADSERDYLVDYPGFQQAYGLPIQVPEPDAPGWAYCAEPTGSSGHTGALSVAQQITGALEALRSSYAPHVVLMFFPRRWDHLRGYRDENERFDVHDFVKAYAVQRGVATQFLTEDTLSDKQQCRVWWWLSLALYVKGMRTPWVLGGLDEDAAYVGLGFSIDRNAEKGNHVVLGCSHIYSARGEGLQYRLSKVENPIMRGKNPFMSRDDARRTGETIRQLFFDARMKLPRRVVLHKRTPFLKEEREGLLDGLGGVATIDMVEIVEDHAQRYVASMPRRDGAIDEDNYPVRRGTVMKLDDFTALLWVHGATAAVNPRFKYFQGKRRIPAPLTLTPSCRGNAARSGLRRDIGAFQDELEHVRPLHQVPGDPSIVRGNRPHRLAAPAVRRNFIRLPPLYLTARIHDAGPFFRSPRVSRDGAGDHGARRCAGRPALCHPADRAGCRHESWRDAQDICAVLLVRPDPSNWSEYPNIWDEVNELIENCPWFKVYDIGEAIHAAFAARYSGEAEIFQDRLNGYLRENGIGWQMTDGRIVYRGSEAFAETTREAVAVLAQAGRSAAANEIHEALADISRRPTPDVTGAIQHSIAALECTARDVAGEPSLTLGRLVPRLARAATRYSGRKTVGLFLGAGAPYPGGTDRIIGRG